MYVRAVLNEGVDQQGMLLPQQALVRDAKANPTTYVVSEDNSVEVRPLELGRTSGAYWIVRSGLKAGDRVIVGGLQKIRPGMKVRVLAPAPLSTPDPASATTSPQG